MMNTIKGVPVTLNDAKVLVDIEEHSRGGTDSPISVYIIHEGRRIGWRERILRGWDFTMASYARMYAAHCRRRLSADDCKLIDLLSSDDCVFLQDIPYMPVQ